MSGTDIVFAVGFLAIMPLIGLLIIAAFQIWKANLKLEKYAATLEARNRELEKAREDLALSQKLASIGTLAAGVARELNNPLTVILGYTSLLLAPQQLHQRDQKGLEDGLGKIRDAAIRTKKIVEGFLLFARMKKPERVSVQINNILTATIELLEGKLAEDRIQVVTHMAPFIPEISADNAQLQQVFLNIITNAQHAMSEAYGKGTLTVTTKPAADRIRIELANDGPPIPTSHLSRIFDPLFTTKAPGKGTGLGLSICYGIVKEHGGILSIENATEQGVCFIIDLPAGEGLFLNGDALNEQTECRI
jgi:two-component system NtrC family sensor kinase